MKQKYSLGKSIHWLLFILLVSACSAPALEPAAQIPEVTALPATNTVIPPSSTPTATTEPTATLTLSPSSTPTQPPPAASATETPAPSESPTALPTETPTQATDESAPAISSASNRYVSMYLIQEGTGGAICGDSAIPVSSGVERKGNVESEVSNALKQLFSIKSEYVGEFLNPLHRSQLRVNKVKFNSENGLITVDLQGSYRPTGDPCDNSRVKAQIWSTIRQYEEIKATNIYLDGIPFGDRLSNDK